MVFGYPSRTRFKIFLFLLCAGAAFTTLYNAVFHRPEIGYDAAQHLKYISVLSDLRLPASMKDTWQYYNPPLYYGIPALAHQLLGSLVAAAKIAQFQNWFFCLGTLFLLLKICGTLRPPGYVKLFSIILLTVMPAFHRTFAMVRTETLLTLLATGLAYQTIHLGMKARWTLKDGLLPGVLLGLVLLTRPTGWILFCPVFVLITALVLQDKSHLRSYLGFAAICLAVALTVGGWFYLRFYFEHGTFIPFHRKAGTTYFSAELARDMPSADRNFYVGFDAGKVFKDPVRTEKIKERRLLESLYKDTWGDYESYFLVYGIYDGKFVSGHALEEMLLNKGKWPRLETNRYSIRRYLARINLIGLFPSLIILAGLVYGFYSFIQMVLQRKLNSETLVPAMLFLFTAFYTAGFIWASVRYIIFAKAAYLFPVYPLAAILGGLVLAKLSEKYRGVYQAAIVMLALCLIHNVPAFFTRYSIFTLAAHGY